MKRPVNARLRRLRDDESGMSLVYVGIGIHDVHGGIDAGDRRGHVHDRHGRRRRTRLTPARWPAPSPSSQQLDGSDGHRAGRAGRDSTAKKNVVIGAAPSVLSTDVTFPNDPAGNPTRVQVKVYRTAERNTAMPTLIGPLFGVPTVDIAATATAEASPANAMTCVKPFMIPDKWTENMDDKGKATGTWTPSLTVRPARQRREFR